MNTTNDNDEDVGLCFLGTMETIIPLQEGRIAPPKKRTNHSKAVAKKTSSIKVIGKAQIHARKPEINIQNNAYQISSHKNKFLVMTGKLLYL